MFGVLTLNFSSLTITIKIHTVIIITISNNIPIHLHSKWVKNSMYNLPKTTTPCNITDSDNNNSSSIKICNHNLPRNIIIIKDTMNENRAINVILCKDSILNNLKRSWLLRMPRTCTLLPVNASFTGVNHAWKKMLHDKFSNKLINFWQDKLKIS